MGGQRLFLRRKITDFPGDVLVNFGHSPSFTHRLAFSRVERISLFGGTTLGYQLKSTRVVHGLGKCMVGDLWPPNRSATRPFSFLGDSY